MRQTSHLPELSETGALPRVATGVLLVLCAAKLLLHLFTSCVRYGYFRDELYYLDMGRHLDWGYVDAAPNGRALREARSAAGRVAVCAAYSACRGGNGSRRSLTVLMARELGGRRYAQLLAGLSILLCPAVLSIDSLMTMNAFEPLFWMAALWCLMRFQRTGQETLWLWLGLWIGLGFENKHSTVFFAVSVLGAILLTPASPGVPAALDLVCNRYCAAHLSAQSSMADQASLSLRWKTLRMCVRRARMSFWDRSRSSGNRWSISILCCSWSGCPGLIWTLRQRRWRVFGLIFVVFFLLMELAHAKNYYVFPIYPVLFAAGRRCCRAMAGAPRCDEDDPDCGDLRGRASVRSDRCLDPVAGALPRL